MERKKRRRRKEMRNVIAVLVFIVGLVTAAYFGIWVMFIQPIIEACAAFDTGTLTAMVIGITVIKCLLATTVSGIIISATAFISGLIQK
jgi:membrane protein YdbS with pleckstrin-like domain